MTQDITPDPWGALRRHTPARIALGRTGVSLPTREVLAFGLAHAQARDAVHLPLDVPALCAQLDAHGWPHRQVHSAAPDRAAYLLRPDLGRRLDEASAAACENASGCDVQLVIADGLSSMAASRHAVPVIAALRAQAPAEWRFGPVVVAGQARVALGDDISSPDSLGLYLTWAPRVGRSDAERNCISNVRPEGLGYEAAARKLLWLCREARRLQLTGIALKDGSEVPLVEAASPPPSLA